MNKWDLRFLNLAREVSTWSKDSTKVGSIIVNSKREIVSLGYNGFARGVDDSSERLENRDLKLSLTLHSEENSILSARQNLEGCTLYVYPFPPCSLCASKIIQVGISRVVAPNNFPERWKESFELSQKIFGEAGVNLELIEGL